MTTTLRVSEDGRDALRALQNAWLSRRGTRPTQQETLEKAIRFALNHEAKFVDEAAWRPLTDQEIDWWEKNCIFDMGPFDSKDIDRIVYGD